MSQSIIKIQSQTNKNRIYGKVMHMTTAYNSKQIDIVVPNEAWIRDINKNEKEQAWEEHNYDFFCGNKRAKVQKEQVQGITREVETPALSARNVTEKHYILQILEPFVLVMPHQSSWDYYLDYRLAYDDQSTSSEWISLDYTNIKRYTYYLVRITNKKGRSFV